MKPMILIAAVALAACQPLTRADAPATIPAGMQGRWGLTENDCDPARADNKGLMVVAVTTLRFYESRATLTGIDRARPDTLTAGFAFTGEGQTWTRRITFELQDAGMLLIRRDAGDGAYPGALRYMNCQAV